VLKKPPQLLLVIGTNQLSCLTTSRAFLLTAPLFGFSS
jgi:hypothetical protein